MPSLALQSLSIEAKRAELTRLLQSPLFLRSPSLAHLLSYLCEKTLAGESDQIKEYAVAVDVFGRHESFDQDTDSIVRVQANRLRKRLADFYNGEGATHLLQIVIPVGQYVPLFEEHARTKEGSQSAGELPDITAREFVGIHASRKQNAWLLAIVLIVGAAAGFTFLVLQNRKSNGVAPMVPLKEAPAEPVAHPVAVDELRILSGSSRGFVDRSGKLWSEDRYSNGGIPVRSAVHHIWRTFDSTIYRTSRQGDFAYDIPLKNGTYELRLHFSETYYGPEEPGGGGEGSRLMNVTANGKILLADFDVLADSGGSRTADVKIFTGVVPAGDGFLHLKFLSVAGGRAMVSAIEILPGAPGRMRPIRVVARDMPYYSNDSHWWSSDIYFKGGQLAASEEPAVETDDPELYETERWGQFSYAVPVAPGKYTLILHFIERNARSQNHGESSALSSSSEPTSRVFNVYCNRKIIIHDLNIHERVGDNRPLLYRIAGLEPNPQGKLFLEFEPVTHYATLTALEVLPQ